MYKVAVINEVTRKVIGRFFSREAAERFIADNPEMPLTWSFIAAPFI